MQLVMVRRGLCSITDVAPVAERACSSTARTLWCITQRRPSLQLVKVGRTDTLVQSPEYPETPELAASEGGAAARLDHRRCPPWLGAPAHRPHGHPDLVQRPEYPETPEPALGSTKAFSQDDEVVQRPEYPETPELAASEGGAAARL